MSRDSSGEKELFGLAAVGLAVCCGLPVLLGAGIASAAVGVGLGSVALVGAGVLLATIALRRRRSRTRSTRAPTQDAIADRDFRPHQRGSHDAPPD